MNTAARRLTRSQRQRVFGGVCGGLAEYLELDVVLVRIAYVAVTLLSAGSGILLYLVAWIIVPPGDRGAEPVHPKHVSQTNSRVIVGVLLAVAGVLALSGSFLPLFCQATGWRVIGPMLLIAGGVVLLFWKRGAEPDSDSGGAPETAHQPESEASRMTEHINQEYADARPKRLVRRHRERKLAGVCAGLGAYFGIDPVIVRLLWIVLILAWGSGIVLYILAWIIMPLEE